MNVSIEVIWDQFGDELGGFIRARVSDPATADDIRQEVFLRIQRRLGQLSDPARLRGWIHHIARNAIIDHYRSQREMEPLPETLMEEVEVEDPEAAGLWAAFRRMIDRLPEPYREAVVLTELEGLTQRELAERLGISLSGAKSRVQRGRRQLKAMLLECCRFELDRRGGVMGCEPHPGEGCPECGGAGDGLVGITGSGRSDVRVRASPSR